MLGKTKSAGKLRRKDKIFAYLVLLWPIIHFCVFTIGMRISVIYSSFLDWPYNTFCGFKNYINVIKTFVGINPADAYAYPKAILNTLSLFPLSYLINTPIALLFSYAIYKKCPASGFFRIALFIPAIISAVVLCLVFKMAVSTSGGFVPALLNSCGLGNLIPAKGFLGEENTAWKMLLIFSVWTGISTHIIYYLSAMGRVPQEVIESAKLDGAGELRQFFSILLPMIWPTVSTMMVSTASALFGWAMPSLLLTQGTAGTSTLGLVILVNSSVRTNLGFVYALCMLVTVVGSITVAVVKKVTESFWTGVTY